MTEYTYMAWSRIGHNGLLPAVISSMAWEGAQVMFSVLPVRGEALDRSGWSTFSGSTLGAWLVSQAGVWLLHACDRFGGAKTSKQEQDPSDKVWQECLQASDLVRTAWNWVSWGKSVITYRGVKAQGATGKRQHDGESLEFLCECRVTGSVLSVCRQIYAAGETKRRN